MNSACVCLLRLAPKTASLTGTGPSRKIKSCLVSLFISATARLRRGSQQPHGTMHPVHRIKKVSSPCSNTKAHWSRLLEGAGKAKEAETQDAAEPEVAKAEPIADFNALREALAGGNMATDAYEETEELIPEEKMPEFPQSDAAEAASDEDAGPRPRAGRHAGRCV